MSIYLDWNATTPPHPRVLEAMNGVAREAWANPSSVHLAGRTARDRVEGVREQLAELLSLQARDIVFTGGGTEANHLALEGATHLLTTPIEHPSVAAQAERLSERGAKVRFASVSPSGVVTPQAVREGLDELLKGQAVRPGASEEQPKQRVVVAVMAANHETGVLQPLGEIAEIVHERGAHLHVDAVQLLGRGSLGAVRHADSLALASHKIRGPRGIGALAFVCGWTPIPLGRGGAQERGFRPGTVDPIGVAGFGAALGRLAESRQAYDRLRALRDRLEAQLLARSGGTAQIHGTDAPRLPHVCNVSFAGWRGDELVAALDLCGIQISSGSACSAGTAEPSPVIRAMLGDDVARKAVRISMGEETTDDEISALLEALSKVGVISSSGT